jgi:hypothetical protein
MSIRPIRLARPPLLIVAAYVAITLLVAARVARAVAAIAERRTAAMAAVTREP